MQLDEKHEQIEELEADLEESERHEADGAARSKAFVLEAQKQAEVDQEAAATELKETTMRLSSQTVEALEVSLRVTLNAQLTDHSASFKTAQLQCRELKLPTVASPLFGLPFAVYVALAAALCSRSRRQLATAFCIGRTEGVLAGHRQPTHAHAGFSWLAAVFALASAADKGAGKAVAHALSLPRSIESSQPHVPLLALDVDETLVNSFMARASKGGGYFDDPLAAQQPFARGAEFLQGCVAALLQEQSGEVMYVHIRPYVLQLLEYLATQVRGERLQVVVFTAGTPAHANPLLDWLGRVTGCSGVLARRFYRETCTDFDEYYVKDLQAIGGDLRYTMLIDNTPSVACQPENLLLVCSRLETTAMALHAMYVARGPRPEEGHSCAELARG